MVKDELRIGAEYAFRKEHTLNCPLQHIRLLEWARGKWKAEWVDPNPGLIDYAAPKQIVARWEDHEGFLLDEDAWAHLMEYNRSLGYTSESPLYLAIEEIFDSTGEHITFHKGILSSSLEAMTRVMARAGLVPNELKLPAYKDRKGNVHLPFDQAMEIGQSFCRAEPLSVLKGVESTERQWSSEASRPGEEYIIPLLNSYRPAWALLRQWCGNDDSTATQEKRINTLVQLLEGAVHALQKAGAGDEAVRIRHILEHGCDSNHARVC